MVERHSILQNMRYYIVYIGKVETGLFLQQFTLQLQVASLLTRGTEVYIISVFFQRIGLYLHGFHYFWVDITNYAAV